MYRVALLLSVKRHRHAQVRFAVTDPYPFLCI